MKRAFLVMAAVAITCQHAVAQLYDRIRCVPYTAASSRGVARFWGGDSPNFRPMTVVSDLRLIVGKQLFVIPRAAFHDLGDISLPEAPSRSEAGEVSVELRGGDGAGTYRCMLVFQRGRLLRREVFGYLAKTPTEVKDFP